MSLKCLLMRVKFSQSQSLSLRVLPTVPGKCWYFVNNQPDQPCVSYCKVRVFSLLFRISTDGVDIVLDCLCGENTGKGLSLLKPLGTYILYGEWKKAGTYFKTKALQSLNSSMPPLPELVIDMLHFLSLIISNQGF